MNDLSGLQGILIAIGSLIGALVTAWKAFDKSKQDRHQDTIDELEQSLKEKKEDAELYRQRWLKAEQDNDRLRKELEDVETKHEND